MFGVIGILSALLQRDITGRGRHGQRALFESAAFPVGRPIAPEAYTGEIPAPVPVRPRARGICETFDAPVGAYSRLDEAAPPADMRPVGLDPGRQARQTS